MVTRKTKALTRWTFVGKVMSLLFNMLSQLVITSLPRNKRLNFMAAVTICSDFGAQENEVSHCFHCFPIYLPWSNGTRCHDLCFLNIMSTFSLSSFHLHQEVFLFLFTFCHKGGVIRVSEMLIFLSAILIPAFASSSPAFLRMYSAYKLNKQGDNIQPWLTPFSIWNQSVVPCPVLTVASSHAYRFLKRQVSWSGTPISLRFFHSLCDPHSQRLWHSQ